MQVRFCWLAGGLSVLMLASVWTSEAVSQTTDELSAATESEPRVFGFALDGQVREAKTECVEGSCSSYVLVRSVEASPESASLQRADLELWRLDTPPGDDGDTAMRRLRFAIPNSAGRLALCERPGSSSLILLQARGSVFFVDPESEDQALAAGTRVGSQTWSAPATPWQPDCSELMLVGPGAIRSVTLAGRGPRRSVLQAQEFPIDFSVRQNGSGLTLESPPVRAVDLGSSMVAVGPQIFDDLRIESLVFEPSQGSARWLEALQGGDEDDFGVSGEMMRSWSRLPAAEEILQSRYTRVNGALVLVAVTKEADKVGLLERKKLRLFELESDRSRSGKLPFFEVLSASRLWQRLDVRFVDLTQDGLEDLVLIQPEGLSGEPTLADVFVATAPRRFAKKKVRTVLETGTVWWSLENDWNGDGRLDLAVLDGDVLQFHHGVDRTSESKRRKRRGGFWSESPSRVVRLSDAPLTAASDQPLKALELAVEELGSSVLQRVWLDDATMVIPTTFARPDADEGSELSVIEGDAAEEASEADAAEPTSESEQGVVYVVRPGGR